MAGSGKKLFRQKGTGNARAGTKRTNKRKGGGVAFARRNRDYRYSMPKQAVRAAIRMALLSKFQDGQALVIDGLALSSPKTQGRRQGPAGDPPARPDRGRGDRGRRRDQVAGPAADARAADDPDRPARATTRSSTAAPATSKGSQVAPVAEFNTYDILKQRYLLLTREALAVLKERVKQEPARRADRAAVVAPAAPEV